jgi:hypothetical protein
LTPGHAEIVLANANTGVVENVFVVERKVRKLLAVGSRFALILLPYVSPDFRWTISARRLEFIKLKYIYVTYNIYDII